MAETAYREITAPPLLPLSGARVYTLQREGGLANFAMMGVWGGTILLVTIVGSLADGRVPDEVLPWVGIPLVVAGLVGAFLVHRRISRGGSGWRLHLASDRAVLERNGEAFDLARANVRVTRYEYQVRATRAAMPTVTIELPGGTSVVVTGPMGVGWVNLGEEEFAGGSSGPRPARSRSPDVRLDDALAFDSLSKRAS